MASALTRSVAGVNVSAIGYGAMSIAGAFYSPSSVSSDEERFAVLDAVYAAGCRNWDLADVYRDAETLVGKWHVFKLQRTGKRDNIYLATKGGIVLAAQGLSVNGAPEYIKQACANSLERLGVKSIDLYYLHRADQHTPIEHTVGALAELVKGGKVKAIGISGVTENTLRRAAAVHPIAALQVEYSPFDLTIEDNGLMKACRELGITIFAYSPLGRGLLTGRYKGPEDFDADDYRRSFPLYSEENFPKILKVVDVVQAIAKKHSATPGQVTLAWLLAQDVIPIPGTRSVKYAEENTAAASVKLTVEEMQEIRTAAEACKLEGPRQPTGFDDLIPQDTPLP